MTYATLTTMMARFGEKELIALTDNEKPYLGQINHKKLNAAMDMANSEVDGYVASQLTVPVANPPSFLVGIACDMARYHAALAATRVSERDEVRYRDARKSLEAISMGKLRIGAPSNAENTQSNNLATMQNGRDSVFGRGGY